MLVTVKKAISAGSVFNSPVRCLLEASSATVLQNRFVTHTLTVGLDNEMSIAPRYVIDNKVLRQLHGNEALCKKQYMKSRNMTRNASVYYDLSQCVAISRISVTVDTLQCKITKCYATFYSLPDMKKNGSVDCKNVALGFATTNRVITCMLRSLFMRGILNFKRPGGTD